MIMESPLLGVMLLLVDSIQRCTGCLGPGPDKGERVGSIVCFVVAASHRHQGVASHLLNAACKKFAEKGLEYAEAYPVKKPPSAAYDFPGPLSMYLKNGFSTYRDADWYTVVRKRLTKPVP